MFILIFNFKFLILNEFPISNFQFLEIFYFTIKPATIIIVNPPKQAPIKKAQKIIEYAFIFFVDIKLF